MSPNWPYGRRCTYPFPHLLPRPASQQGTSVSHFLHIVNCRADLGTARLGEVVSHRR